MASKLSTVLSFLEKNGIPESSVVREEPLYVYQFYIGEWEVEIWCEPRGYRGPIYTTHFTLSHKDRRPHETLFPRKLSDFKTCVLEILAGIEPSYRIDG